MKFKIGDKVKIKHGTFIGTSNQISYNKIYTIVEEKEDLVYKINVSADIISVYYDWELERYDRQLKLRLLNEIK
jgi:hypothetical protein